MLELIKTNVRQLYRRKKNIFAWGMLVKGRCCWKWCKTHQFQQLAVATCTSPSNKTGRKVIYVVVTVCRKGLNPVLLHLFSMISEKQRILVVKRDWKTLPGGKPRKPVLIIGLLLTEVLTSHRQVESSRAADVKEADDSCHEGGSSESDWEEKVSSRLFPSNSSDMFSREWFILRFVKTSARHHSSSSSTKYELTVHADKQAPVVLNTDILLAAGHSQLLPASRKSGNYLIPNCANRKWRSEKGRKDELPPLQIPFTRSTGCEPRHILLSTA